MSLPDINEMYPQEEPPTWSKCTDCGSEIRDGDEYVEAAGYHYCDVWCLTRLMLKEGNAVKRIAGE